MQTGADAWLQTPPRERNLVMAQRAAQRQSTLTKPPGSLGLLEQIAIDLAAMQGTDKPRAQRVFISVFAADHGVVAEGVAAYPQAVTQQMLSNIANGGAAISVLACELGARLEVVDVGTLCSRESVAGVIVARAGAATENLRCAAAMLPAQLTAAMWAGRDAVARAIDYRADVFIAGDMGIGNTTAAAAVAAALLERDAQETAGPGTGLDVAGVARKVDVIREALRLHAPDPARPLEVLQTLGGFELAAMAGAYVACAQAGVTALVDGFIAGAAALAACRIQPATRDWLVFAHRSAEPGHRLLLEALGARPLLDLDLRLGEGSGAALAMNLLRSACELHNGMATFAEAGVADRGDA